MLSSNPRAVQIREERAFYKSIGLCPRCGKNKLFGDEKNCPECSAKMQAYARKYEEENREEFRQYVNNYHKSVYQQRKEAGLCVRCGKRKPLHNEVRCGICKQKMQLRRQERRMKNSELTRKERLERGLCYFCGAETVPGMKVCEKHRDICIENANKSARDTQRKAIKSLFPRKESAS